MNKERIECPCCTRTAALDSEMGCCIEIHGKCFSCLEYTMPEAGIYEIIQAMIKRRVSMSRITQCH